MARIFNEGFELGHKGQFYSAQVENYEVDGNGKYPPRVPGGRVASFPPGGFLTARLEGLAEFYTRFLYFCKDWSEGHHYGRRLALADTHGATVAEVHWGYEDQLDAEYGVGLYLGTSTTPVASSPTLLRSHEHRAVIEVHFRYTLNDSSTASPNFEMRVNGATVLTYTGPTALEPAEPPEEPLEYAIRDITYAVPPKKWGALDDVAINDTTGNEDNSWCGDGVIVLLKPNGSSVAQLARSHPAKQNHQLVSDMNVATWVESDVAGQHDIYTVAVPTMKANDTVRRVWAAANARKLHSDSPGIMLGIDKGAGMQWSEGLPLGIDLTGVQGEQLLGDSWTPAQLAALRIGVKIE